MGEKYTSVRMLEEHRYRESKYVILDLACGHKQIVGAEFVGDELLSIDLDEAEIRKWWRSMRGKEPVFQFCNSGEHKIGDVALQQIDRMTIYSSSGGPWRITKDGIRGYTEPKEAEKLKVSHYHPYP